MGGEVLPYHFKLDPPSAMFDSAGVAELLRKSSRLPRVSPGWSWLDLLDRGGLSLRVGLVPNVGYTT
jgi:hypothetical protein